MNYVIRNKMGLFLTDHSKNPIGTWAEWAPDLSSALVFDDEEVSSDWLGHLAKKVDGETKLLEEAYDDTPF